MNILVINTNFDPLKSNLIKFLLNNKDFKSIIILNFRINVITSETLPNAFDSFKRIYSLNIDLLDSESLSLMVNDLISKFKSFSYLIYNETIPKTTSENFGSISIPEFKSILILELQKKINFFQIFLKKLKDLSSGVKILILIPELAQTRLISGNMAESILFTSLHMITTAIADEFIDYHIICNGVIKTDRYLETINWLIDEKTDLPHGKLFQDKKIMDW